MAAGALVFLLPAIPLAGSTESGTARKEEDKKLLEEVRLPADPRRGPDEQYLHRFLMRTAQGRIFVGAYWREEGSFVQGAIDIFAVEGTAKRPVVRRVHTEGLGGEVLALDVIDLDGDGRDDLLIIHHTGGNIATTGVTALGQTATGFSRIFFYAGSDILVYRDRGKVRMMVKARTSKQVEEFAWNPSKHTFTVTRTFELLY